MFNIMSIEPTFMPLITVPAALMKHQSVRKALDNFYSELCDIYESNQNCLTRHRWEMKKYQDNTALEYPSGKYKNLSALVADYEKLERALQQKGFFPSSVIDMEIEGGCHVNVDLSFLDETKDFKIKMMTNLLYYLQKHPSFVWAFLAPTDNNSAHITQDCDFRSMRKGNVFTVRDDNKSIFCSDIWYKTPNYVELRFFMMPRNAQELVLHLTVAQKLMMFIYKNTKAGMTFKYEPKLNYKKYTLKKAKKELIDTCKELKIEYAELKMYGKHKMLEDRFAYGKNYLV